MIFHEISILILDNSYLIFRNLYMSNFSIEKYYTFIIFVIYTQVFITILYNVKLLEIRKKVSESDLLLFDI